MITILSLQRVKSECLREQGRVSLRVEGVQAKIWLRIVIYLIAAVTIYWGFNYFEVRHPEVPLAVLWIVLALLAFGNLRKLRTRDCAVFDIPRQQLTLLDRRVISRDKIDKIVFTDIPTHGNLREYIVTLELTDRTHIGLLSNLDQINPKEVIMTFCERSGLPFEAE